MDNYKQGRDSINVYYSRLRKLWDEIENYSQLPPSANNSEILAIVTKDREEDRVYQFLMRLNDKVFRIVRSNIIQGEPLPKLKHILARICKEKHWNMARAPATEEKGGAAIAFTAMNKLVAQNGSRIICSHFQKSGHISPIVINSMVTQIRGPN